MNLTWPTWLTHNPVAWVALANGLINAAIVFGVPISDPEKFAIATVLGLISVLFVQSQVTSTAKLSSLGVTITPVAQSASVLPVTPASKVTVDNVVLPVGTTVVPVPAPTQVATVVPPQVPPV